jgi:DNA polymerase-3 subunit epsilon
MTSVRDLMPPPPVPFTGIPWFDLRFASFDLETTSADPEDARIVAAAAIEIGGRRATDSRTWLVDPGIEIPADATAVHGITTEHAHELGELPGDAVPAIVDRLAARPEGCPIVVFNAAYDLTVLDRECRRYGVQPLQDRGTLLVVDPLVIDKHIHRYRPGSRKQAPMCAHYNLGLEADAHDADYDARCAAFLARRICRNASVIRRDDHETWPLQAEWDRIRCDPAALHDAQVGWYAFQARGLAAHFRSQGKRDEADRVREDWPIVP